MENNIYAVSFGQNFGFVPTDELRDIKLTWTAAVRFEGKNWDLFKGVSANDAMKLDLLLKKHGEYSVKDYQIEPVMMSGEVELVLPGFDKDRDSFLFGGYSFVCDGKVIPVDFSGTAWDIEQEGDTVQISFVTGKTSLLTDYYLDPCYEDDYANSGLRYQDITAEFLSQATAISEFMIGLEMDGREYQTEDLAKLGDFKLKSLCFESEEKEHPFSQRILDAFNESLRNERISSLDHQIHSASSRTSQGEKTLHHKWNEAEKGI